MKKTASTVLSAAIVLLLLTIPLQSASQTIIAQSVGGVRVLVIDNSGMALGGASVSAVVAGQTLTQLTNLRGEAIFRDLPAGQFTYRVSKAGYATQSAVMSFTVQASVVSTSKCVMIKLGSARVRVSYTGVPVAGASVSTSVNRRIVTMTTDAAGTALFGSLLPGNYTFAAQKTEYTGNKAAANVASGQEASVPITLTKTGGLAVTVKDGTTPVEGAAVNISGPGVSKSANTNAQGIAAFSGLASGTWLLSATKAGYAFSEKQIIGAEVPVNQTAQAAYPMRKLSGSLEVAVTGGNGPINPALPNANVSLTGQGLARTLASDSQGKALFTGLPLGDYIFNVTKDGFVASSNNAVKITETSYSTPWKYPLNLLSSPKITFTVTENATPVSGATVTLSPASGVPQSAITDAQGIAVFTNGVNYNSAYSFAVAKAGYSSSSGTATISATIPDLKYSIMIVRTSTLVVTVTDGVNPLAGASVDISSGANPQFSDSQGRVTFSNVTAGEKFISARKDGYPSDSKKVTIAAGETQTVPIVLPRYRVVSATVTPNSGRLGQGTKPALSVTIDRPADSRGASVYFKSSDPQFVSVPASMGIPAGASSAAVPISILPMFSNTQLTAPRQVTISAGSGMSFENAGVQASAIFTVSPITLKTLVPISSVPVQPLYAGSSLDKGVGYVSTDAPNPETLQIILTSSEPDVMNFTGTWESNPVPYPLQLIAGSTTINIKVAAIPLELRKTRIGEDRDVAVTAEFCGQRLTAMVPVLWPRTITSLVISPPNQYGTSTATVTLDRPAPARGLQLSINSSNRSAFYTLPYAVNLSGGQTSATFSLAFKGPGYSGTTVTVTATPYWNTSATATVPLQ